MNNKIPMEVKDHCLELLNEESVLKRSMKHISQSRIAAYAPSKRLKGS